MSRSAARFALFALLAFVAACDKVALLAPTGSTVTLSVSSTSVGGNGTAAVVATVIEAGGTPVHNGTEVTFQSSVGTIEPATARTEGGVARATFRANGASGTARVIAFSGGAASDEVELRVGSAAAETVTVRATPSSIPQNGGPIQVTATVRDVSGNPLPGAQVVFAADNGSLSSNSSVTDANGEANVTLTTTRQTIVRASVAGKEGQATINVASFPTASITLTPATPLVGQPFQLTITPTVPAGGSPVQTVIVDFGDGTERTLGSAGGAQSIAHVYSRAGTYTITATLIDAAGQRSSSSTVVTVQRPIVSVTFATPPPTAAVGSPVPFTVSVTNTSNIPLENVIVSFGDGKSATLPPFGGTVTNVYLGPGQYTVRARAVDQSGIGYESTHQILITP